MMGGEVSSPFPSASSGQARLTLRQARLTLRQAQGDNRGLRVTKNHCF